MPRRPRLDAPGRLHHVVARGHDRRRLFEFPADYRCFLALLICAVHAGRIRLHAYALMPNHVHLLVESVDGNLPATMQWILGRYGAYFNRTRKHTGHAFDGRYHSSPVLSRAYLYRVVRYIDRNAVKAGLCDSPLAFPYGSARHHARPGSRPLWLARSVVERFLPPSPVDEEERRRAYMRIFHRCRSGPDDGALVEARLAGRAHGVDDLDALLQATSEEVGAWLRGRAQGNVGSSPPLAMVDPGSVTEAVAVRAASADPSSTPDSNGRGRRKDPWRVLEMGLLRDLGGLTYTAASRLVGVSVSQARERYLAHRRAVDEDDAYRRLAGEAGCRAIDLAFGEVVRWILNGPASAECRAWAAAGGTT